MRNNTILKTLNGRRLRKMNKIIVSLICTALVLSMPAVSFAAFTSDSTQVKTAQVTVGGTAGVPIALTVTLKNVSTGGGTPTAISWTSVNAGALDWKAADQYLEVGGFATHATWGIQIYTDNANASASPRYDGTGNPAGLVLDDADHISSITLPMAWRVLIHSTIRPLTWPPATLETSFQEKYIDAINSIVILRQASDYVSPTEYFAPWSWMLDKNTPDVNPGNGDTTEPFGTNQDVANIVGSDGARVGSGDVPLSYTSIPERAAKYCVLLGAKFTSASASATYKTSRLVVEMYHL